MKPKLSIVIPSHNPTFLWETLTSIYHQRETHVLDYEVIVVENPPGDNLFPIVASFGPNFHHVKSELGSNNARNKGISCTQADLIAITDDDCEVCDTWVSQILALHREYDSGIIAGPLLLKYTCEKPAWLVSYLELLLSKCEWPTLDGPYDLSIYPNRWVVSANLSFKRSTYDAVGGLNGNIGYHGRDFISNDEIQFVNKCAKLGDPGILYSPALIVNHLIPPDRCTIEFLKKKAYGQGASDAVMWLEEHKGSIEDIYHDHFQYKMTKCVDYENILAVRNLLHNEDLTRHYIKNMIKTRLSYVSGVEEYLCKKQL